jgi:hypothetical protein
MAAEQSAAEAKLFSGKTERASAIAEARAGAAAAVSVPVSHRGSRVVYERLDRGEVSGDGARRLVQEARKSTARWRVRLRKRDGNRREIWR